MMMRQAASGVFPLAWGLGQRPGGLLLECGKLESPEEPVVVLGHYRQAFELTEGQKHLQWEHMAHPRFGM